MAYSYYISNSKFSFINTIFIRYKKTWEGNFKIVLDNVDGGNSLLDSGQRSLVDTLLGSQIDMNNNLKTEVVILESPSVLKPVFKFAKRLKSDPGENVESWRYEKWVDKKLNINLKKGTSVLKISYRDSNKNHILPILDMMSKTYQDYSKSERDNNIKKGIKYANEQLANFKEKSKISNRNVDFYELEYGINKGTKYPGNVSALTGRFSAIPEILSTGGSILSEADAPENDVLTKLGQINLELVRRRQYFKESDKSIQNLLKEKNFYKNISRKLLEAKLHCLKKKI